MSVQRLEHAHKQPPEFIFPCLKGAIAVARAHESTNQHQHLCRDMEHDAAHTVPENSVIRYGFL